MAVIRLAKTAARLKRERARLNETNAIVWPLIRALNEIDGVQVWRNNTGRLPDANGRPVTYGLALGSSDIIGILNGLFLAIECKRPGEEPTEDQWAFLRLVAQAGGIAGWVTSVEDGVAFVRGALL